MFELQSDNSLIMLTSLARFSRTQFMFNRSMGWVVVPTSSALQLSGPDSTIVRAGSGVGDKHSEALIDA